MASLTPNLNELIPRKVLFGSPVKVQPKISPDGKKIAYLAPVNNLLNIWVRTIGENDDRVVTKDEKRSIKMYAWAENNEDLIYLQDTGGNENWNIYKANIKTGEIKNLTPFENVQAGIINIDKKFPHEILISMNKENPTAKDVYRLNLKSGELQPVAKNPGHIKWWIKDGELNVSGGVGPTSDGGDELIIRKGDNWERLDSWDYEDTFTTSAICITRDGRYLYLIDSRNTNTSRLVKIEIQTGKREILFQDTDYDLTGWIDYFYNAHTLLINPDTYEIEAIVCYKEKQEWIMLDENLKSDFEAAGKLWEGEFSIVSRDSLNMNEMDNMF